METLHLNSKSVDTGFPYQFIHFAVSSSFSLQIKTKMYRMYTVFNNFFENIQYYLTPFNMVQKDTNKVGVTS